MTPGGCSGAASAWTEAPSWAGSAAGRHEATWQAGKLPSGTYFYRLTAGAFSQTKAMALLK